MSVERVMEAGRWAQYARSLRRFIDAWACLVPALGVSAGPRPPPDQPGGNMLILPEFLPSREPDHGELLVRTLRTDTVIDSFERHPETWDCDQIDVGATSTSASDARSDGVRTPAAHQPITAMVARRMQQPETEVHDDGDAGRAGAAAGNALVPAVSACTSVGAHPPPPGLLRASRAGDCTASNDGPPQHHPRRLRSSCWQPRRLRPSGHQQPPRPRPMGSADWHERWSIAWQQAGSGPWGRGTEHCLNSL
jgi:hypothetical protein